MTIEDKKLTIGDTTVDLLSADDTFSFRCTKCGKCCKDREDVLLNPYDVFRIAKYLGEEVEDILQTYTKCHIGATSRMPVVVIRPSGKRRTCPFLTKQQCRIQEAKPSVCALFPLGRLGDGDGDILYILQPISCGKQDESHTVQEWLAEHNLEDSEEWFHIWYDAMLSLGTRVREIEPYMSEPLFEKLEETIFRLLYPGYYLNEPFIPQAKQKLIRVDDLLTSIEKILDVQEK